MIAAGKSGNYVRRSHVETSTDRTIKQLLGVLARYLPTLIPAMHNDELDARVDRDFAATGPFVEECEWRHDER